MFSIPARSRRIFSSLPPSGSANTTAFPVGRPQELEVGSTGSGPRETSAPAPRISRPASSTRSACGPHTKGPGSATSNRQVSPVPSGRTVHARPPATNAMVCETSGVPGSHPSGRAATSAIGPVEPGGGDGETLGVAADGPLGRTDEGLVTGGTLDPVQAAHRNSRAREPAAP